MPSGIVEGAETITPPVVTPCFFKKHHLVPLSLARNSKVDTKSNKRKHPEKYQKYIIAS
jgi:hypothetical protein